MLCSIGILIWLDKNCIAPEDRVWISLTFFVYSAMQVTLSLASFGLLRLALSKFRFDARP